MADKEISIELRLVAAFALSFVILLGSRYFLAKYGPATPAKPPAKQITNSASARSTTPPATPSNPATAAQTAPAPAADTKVGTAEQQITVENDLYRVVFSTKGAVVKNWFLKGYRDEKNNALDLVDQAAAQQFGDPLAIWTSDPDLRNQLTGALFVASPASNSIQAPATLTFEYNDGRITARKEIAFHEKDYLVEIKTDVWNGGKAVSHQVAWRGGFGDVHDIGIRGNVVDVFYRDPEKIKRLTASDVKTGEATASGQFDFAGIEDRFFTASFLPQAGPLTVLAFRQDVASSDPKQKPRPSVGMAVGSLDSPQNRLRLYVGPKQADVLATIAPRLPEVIDYGWFALVAKPLFIALRWIYEHVVSNYGWAIILLTVFINFALFPLKLKSLRSTMKMQKIQPQMKAIQDKYKQYKATDPRKGQMNQEMMELYKKHGVNPLGGCLPMLIQLPFLYGFYRVLMASIEMRHAPFFWWINDLSAPESISIRVLPLLLCITQFILQRMSPSPSPDPAQQKMMMLMPIMFLFMFWSMSSGLVLYWLTGNVVGIAQQWYINKTEMKQAVEQKKLRKAGKKE